MRRTVLALILGALPLALPASAGDILGFTEQVSPAEELNATEPYVAIDRNDGTVWVAWQASGTHVARSDNGGRSFVQTPIVNPFGNDIGDVDIAVGGPTPCAVPTTSCLPGTRRVYVTSLEFDRTDAGTPATPGGTCFATSPPSPCTLTISVRLSDLGISSGNGLYGLTGLSNYFFGTMDKPPLLRVEGGNSELADATAPIHYLGSGTP